jgi:hypothetical protein
MRYGFIVLLLISFSALAAEQVYKWQDKNGRWHYSDKPVNTQAVEEVSVEGVTAIDWQETPTVKPTPKRKAAKGKGNLQQKQKRCEYLTKKVKYYEAKSREKFRNTKYRQKKRHYRWLKQKEC